MRYVVRTPRKGMCYWCPLACKYWATRPPASDPNEVGKPPLVKSLSSESDNPATLNKTYSKARLFIKASSSSLFSSRIVGTIECQNHWPLITTLGRINRIQMSCRDYLSGVKSSDLAQSRYFLDMEVCAGYNQGNGKHTTERIAVSPYTFRSLRWLPGGIHRFLASTSLSIWTHFERG